MADASAAKSAAIAQNDVAASGTITGRCLYLLKLFIAYRTVYMNYC
jgi:hypothetical protein